MVRLTVPAKTPTPPRGRPGTRPTGQRSNRTKRFKWH